MVAVEDSKKDKEIIGGVKIDLLLPIHSLNYFFAWFSMLANSIPVQGSFPINHVLCPVLMLCKQSLRLST
jgi:hypothetical protein